jgi:hypothetical protein
LLQERNPHLVHCGAAFNSPCAPLQELVPHSLEPVLQPPVVGPQGLDKDVKASYWSRYQLCSELS